MDKKILFLPELFISFFVLLGLYLFLLGIFPINMEIIPLADRTEVQIHKKSLLIPFKDVNIVIPNVKQAVIGSSRSSKGGTTYRVELESFDGTRTPITSYYSSGYTPKETLQKNINKAIQDRTEYKHVIRQTFLLIFGFIFTFIPSLMLIGFISQTKKTTEPSEQKQTQEGPQRYQTTYTSSTNTEEDKYKNINDSIIK